MVQITFAQDQDEKFRIKYENPTEELGMGLLKLDYLSQPIIEIFNDSKLESKYANWDTNLPTIEIYPKFYEFDYGICDFILLEATDTYYKVLIGFNKVKYVKPSKFWRLITWKGLIESSFGVTRKRDSRVTNKLRSLKSENSPEIPLELKIHENFCVNSLEDSWLNVKYDCIYATDEYDEFEGLPCFEYIDKCDDNRVGWIKWKQDGELLVEIYLLP